MKKIFSFVAVLTAISGLFFVSCEPDEIVDPISESGFLCTTSFSIKNNTADQKEIGLFLLKKLETGIWSTEFCYEKEYVNKNDTKTFTLQCDPYINGDENSLLCCSVAIRIGNELYIGFSKNEPNESFDISRTDCKITKDNLHIVKMNKDKSLPIIDGTLSPKSKTGIVEGKQYMSVSEHFTVTIGDEIPISLDSTKFE